MSSIPFLDGWESAAELLREEIRQLTEEGRSPQWLDDFVLQNRSRMTDAELWEKLQSAPPRKDFPYREPSGLEEIRRERPAVASRVHPLPYGDDVLLDRLHGAWLGRCCGCALGKPVELFMGPHNGLSSRARLKVYLEGIGPDEYPLRDYFPLHSPTEGRTGALNYPLSCRENLAFMESDDDIRYTVIAQRVLMEKGLGFTTRDVMKAWQDVLPYTQVCTAESQAYRNFMVRYGRAGRHSDIDWTWVATQQNPYREWIGAQIRADGWGYAAPANPELAAELAWRDARMTHVKNGIHGEMFVAAMIAAAFALEDPLAVIEAGLAEIPLACRLQEDIRRTIVICREHDFQWSAFETILLVLEKEFGHYHPVHTNNNAAVVVAALLLGQHDFERVITFAVMAGWDTDCNGATSGSIFGAMHGAGAIPPKWKDPLRDTLYAEVAGYQPIAISACARRSLEIVQKEKAPK